MLRWGQTNPDAILRGDVVVDLYGEPVCRFEGRVRCASRMNRFWPDLVRLVDPAGKKSYSVNMMQAPPFWYCECSQYPLHVGPDPVQMTAAYPALPATTTTVSVRIPNFAPVTVPVTRSAETPDN